MLGSFASRWAFFFGRFSDLKYMFKPLSCDHIEHNFKEKPAMLNISEIVACTEAMFDLFNTHFYNNELQRPAITVSPDGGHGAYGWCSVYEIWQGNGEAHR